MMKMSLTPEALEEYILKLCAGYFPDNYEPKYSITPLVKLALERTEYCFSRIHRKYFNHDGVTNFNHLNSDHMSMFTYFIGNTIWKETSETLLPEKLFYLNKVMNGIDLYYSVSLPDIFVLVHAVGTVLGHAQYSDYLVVYQGCTVGSIGAFQNKYPILGKGVALSSRSSVIGECTIGDNVLFAAASQVIATNVDSDTVVFGNTPDITCVKNKHNYMDRWFNEIAK